jgi:hypothetical protein
MNQPIGGAALPAPSPRVSFISWPTSSLSPIRLRTTTPSTSTSLPSSGLMAPAPCTVPISLRAGSMGSTTVSVAGKEQALQASTHAIRATPFTSLLRMYWSLAVRVLER